MNYRIRQIQPAGDGQNQVLQFSIFSEAPYRRQDEQGEYMEVLPVSALDWSRLNSGAMAFLLDHDPEKQIGVVVKAWADGQKVRAAVKFSSSDQARQIVQDIKSGVRTNCSIGYVIDEARWEDRDGQRYLIAEKFLVYEASLVSVPADTSVGYQRKQEMKKMKKRNSAACDQDLEKKEDQAVAEAGQEVHDEVEALIAAVEEMDADKAEAIRKLFREDPEVEEAGEEVHDKIQDLLAAVEKLDAEKAEEIRKLLREEPEAEEAGEAPAEEEARDEEPAAPHGKLEGEPDEQDQIRSLGALTGRRAEAARFISGHKSLKEFKNFLRGMTNSKPQKNMNQKFNLQKAIRSAVKGERDTESYEFKTSEANRRQFGAGQADIVVTRAQLRGFPDGTEALSQTTYRPDLYTENLRPEKTYKKLGLTEVAADTDISFAVCTSGLNAGFVDINNEIPSATAEWSLKTLQPKKMGAYCQIGYRALLTDKPEIQALITQDILGSLEDCKDRAVINGSGEDNEPLGVYGTSGVNTVTMPDTWSLSTALAFEKPIRDSNNFSDNLKWVMNSTMYYKLAATPKSAQQKNEFLIDDDRKMIGYDCYIDNALPTSGIILGDFSDVIAVDYDPINIKIVEDAGLSRKQAVQVQAFSAFNLIVRRPSSFTKGA